MIVRTFIINRLLLRVSFVLLLVMFVLFFHLVLFLLLLLVLLVLVLVLLLFLRYRVAFHATSYHHRHYGMMRSGNLYLRCPSKSTVTSVMSLKVLTRQQGKWP